MTEGRHYWEVEITSGCTNVLFGAVRPGPDLDTSHHYGNDAYFILGYDGGLWGNGKRNADPQGDCKQGDRVGVLLDLDAGWMRFFRSNGKCLGPGFTEEVTGPLVRAAQLIQPGIKLTVLPGAAAPRVAPPEGAEDADEPQE
jgi:hypothetical protein